MEIYTLNAGTIALGEQAFRDCVRQYLGSSLTGRYGGTAVIPGAISAAVRAGITDKQDICRIVARVARCSTGKVSTILHGLAGEDVAGRLWAQDEWGAFHPEGRTGRIPAAIVIG